jgi:Sulfotransferase domain
VPPERLLVYRVADGWGPLCRFLSVHPPDEPFPRINTRPTFIDNGERAITRDRQKTGCVNLRWPRDSSLIRPHRWQVVVT